MKIITNNATAKEKIGHVGDEHIETLRAFDDNDGWNGVGTIPATNVDGTDTWTLNAANNSSVRRDVLYATNQNDEFQVTLRIRATSGTPTVRLAFIHEGNWNDVMFETIQLSTSFQTFEATGIADLTANYSFRIRNDSTTVKTIQLQFFSIRRISPRTFTTTEYDWLEDMPVPRYTDILDAKILWRRPPIAATGSVKQNMSNAEWACFDQGYYKIFNWGTVESAQGLNPNLCGNRILCAMEFQGASDAAGKTGNGIPWQTTGPTTNKTGQVFAGHWLYKERTTTTAFISSSATYIPVDSTANLTAGQYVCIYDNNSFAGAEFCRIGSIGTNPPSITIASRTCVGTTSGGRGTRSTAKSHNSGAYVAEVQEGNGPYSNNCGADASSAYRGMNFQFNMSNLCPEDGNGKKLNQVAAEHYADIMSENGNGVPVTGVDGWINDSDFYIHQLGGGHSSRRVDADNDGTADWGLDDGTWYNEWGRGLKTFVETLRSELDARGGIYAKMTLGIGDYRNLGITAHNAGQFEAVFTNTTQEENLKGPSVYTQFASGFSSIKAHLRGSVYPTVGDMQNKVLQAQFPPNPNVSPPETSNHDHRLLWGMAAILGQGQSEQNYKYPPSATQENFKWFEENACCLVPGGQGGYSFGQLIPHSQVNDIRNYKNWLGRPIGPYRRLYTSDFALANNKTSDPYFDSGITGWSVESGASLSWSTEQQYSGARSLKCTISNPGNNFYNSNEIISPTVVMSAGWHTLCFAIYSPVERVLDLAGGGLNLAAGILIPDGWSKHAISTQASGNSTFRFGFACESSPLFIDQFMVYEGTADVFYREFENGLVITNATNSNVTVELGDEYMIPAGTQEPAIWTGATVDSHTIPAWDSLAFIRLS